MTKKESTPKRAKGGGGKLSRSEIVQTRLSPKLRFIAEIMARHQRRTLSSLIEGLIEEAAEHYEVPMTWTKPEEGVVTMRQNSRPVPVSDAMHWVWSIEDADRFAAFAFHLPTLLTPEEERVWLLIRETAYFWLYYNVGMDTKKIRQMLDIHDLIRERLREHWPLLQAILEGKESIETFKQLQLGEGLQHPDSVKTDIIYEASKKKRHNHDN